MSSESPFLYYNPTKILCGSHALTHLPYELTQLEVDLPFVMIDSRAPITISKKIITAFKGSGITLALFEDVPLAPNEKQLGEMATLFSENNCNAILAVGKDPVVNAARLLALTLTNQVDPARYAGHNQLQTQLPPMIQVPCGLYCENGGLPLVRAENWRAVSPFLMPDLAVLDTSFYKSLEPLQKIACVLTPLSICLESVAARAGNPITESLAMSTLTTVMNWLMLLLEEKINGFDDVLTAHAQITGGLVMAGSELLALPILADELSQTCDGDRGIISGILVPYMLEILARKNPGAVGELLLSCGQTDLFALAAEGLKARCTINIFHDIMQRLSRMSSHLIATTLEGAGVPYKSLDRIAQSFFSTESEKKNWDMETVLELLTHAWRGIPITTTERECFDYNKN